MADIIYVNPKDPAAFAPTRNNRGKRSFLMNMNIDPASMQTLIKLVLFARDGVDNE